MNELPAPLDMAAFDPGVPTGDATFAIIYAECRHSRWRRGWDRLRGREHPAAHVVHYSPLREAMKLSWTKEGLIDFDADTITMRLADEAGMQEGRNDD